MDKIKLGFLGLGQRGRGLITNVLGNFPDVDIVAVCDEYADRTEDEAKRVLEARGVEPAKYTHHSQLLDSPGHRGYEKGQDLRPGSRRRLQCG